MRRLKRISPALLLLAFLLFPSTEARADEVVITSGFLSLSSPSLGGPFRSLSFDFGGDNLRARGSEVDGPHASPGWNCPFPCTAGSTLSVTTTSALFTWIPATSLQFNGQQLGPGWFTGSLLSFSTDPFTIPPSGDSVILLTTHFTMTGQIGYEHFDGNFRTGRGVFITPVVGSGIATVRMERLGSGYLVTGVTYSFQPTSVPEPVTLVLFGSGLAGLAARHRRCSRRRREQQEEIS